MHTYISHANKCQDQREEAKISLLFNNSINRKQFKIKLKIMYQKSSWE